MSSGGGGTNTVTQQSGPPQSYIDAYNQVFGQAQNVAATPNTQYSGQTVAGLSPDQSAGITATENAYGTAAPYINSAAQYINNSTTPLSPTVQPYVDTATGLYNNAAGLDTNAASIYNGLTSGLTPEEIQRYESPYTKSVVDATQAQFNNQNAIQQNQLAGQAGTSGAYGGDRQAVAQAVLAGQQQANQAPTIANLENQGYMTGLNTAQQQQGVRAGAAQGLIGAGQGMGTAGAGILGASGQLLGANEANAWLNSQAGAGMANLGNAAQTSSLTGANALLGVGGLEQQQAQSELNVPYQQYLAQQAYPFQTTGWLANIAEGLGGASGGTSSTTSPSASTGSQIAGTALAGAGILGQTGAYGSNGWLSNLFGSGASGAASAASDIPWDLPTAARGGMIPHRAPGGSLPPFGSAAPVSSTSPYGMSLPDMSVSVVPGSAAGQFGNSSGHIGSNLMKTSTGSTSTTSGGGSNVAGDVASTALKLAPLAIALLKRGGIVPLHQGSGMRPVNDNWSGGWSEPKRAAGGATQVTIVPGSYANSPGVPQLSMAPLNLTPTGNGMSPAAAGAQGFASASSNPTVQAYLAGTLGGASFAPPPVYTPPAPPAPPAAPTITNDAATKAAADAAQAAEDAYHQDQSNNRGNRDGGRLARLADGGSGEGPLGDDYYPDDPFTLLPPPPPDAVDPITQGLEVQALRGAGAQPAGGPTGTVATTPSTAHAGMGPPPAPAAARDATDVPWDLSSNPGSAANTHASSSGSPWRTLTDVGLGIMGGTSPNALTNIGRGALQGLRQADTERQADIRQLSEENAAKRLSDIADATLARIKQGDAKVGIDQQKADTADRAVDVRQAVAARAAELKAQGMSDAQANAQAKLDNARGWLGVQQQRADTADRGVDVQQQRANTADRAVALRQKAVQSSQDFRQQSLALRQQGMDQQTSSNVMNNASRMVSMDLSGKLTLAEAVKQQLANRPGTAAAPAPPATPQIAPMPKSAAEAVPGTVYNTARGPARWDGTQFIPVSP